MKPEKTYIEIERFFLHHFKEYFSSENQFDFDDDKITFPSCENSTFPDLIKRVINYSKLNSQELLPDLLALKNLYENSAVHTFTFNDLMTYYTESDIEELNEQIQKLENTANELKNNIDKFLDIFNTSNGEYPIELTDYFQNLKHIDRHSICNIIGYDYSNKFESVMKFINPKID